MCLKKRGDAEKQFVNKAVARVIKAARLKPQKIDLLRHEFKNPKPNRTELHTKAVTIHVGSVTWYHTDQTYWPLSYSLMAKFSSEAPSRVSTV